MSRLIHTARAEEDLIELWLYIAQDNPSAADAFLDRINERCLALAENPLLGPARDDIAAGLRYFPVGNYLILYRIIEGGIEVVRIVHGARNLEDIV